MAIKCGNCKEHHETVADVSACYRGKYGAPQPTCGRMGDAPMWPASDAQINYVVGLQEERNLPDDYKVKDAEALTMMERDEVSGLISLLKTFSRKEGSTTRKEWDMPAGRYAVLHDDKQEWWFFEVGKPTEGRWAGYTFIKRLIGAPGQYKKVDMSPAERQGWLTAIEKDPNTAMTDYGMQSGVCGKCSSPLSDPKSLERGIGPVCLSKLGW